MKTLLFAILSAQIAAAGTAPQVSNVEMKQLHDRSVEVTYTLTGGPAIVTVDFLTDDQSIGAENFTTLTGDVNTLVSGDETRKLVWNATKDWPEHKIATGVSAIVTAWAPDTPPDYMVADLVTGQVNYYISANALPGGINDNLYKTSKLLCKRIRARNIPWQMGTTAELGKSNAEKATSTVETPHSVTLDHDYWMGVFEFTQGQWALMMDGAMPSYANYEGDRIYRPVEQVGYNKIRGDFRNALRNKTNIAFDLPSEAEWEFACRGGFGEGTWGDGSAIAGKDADENLLALGRTTGSGVNTAQSAPAAEGRTNIVGSYLPNGYGLYDMHGNVFEWTQDWYSADIAGNTNGSGDYVTEGTQRVVKGGAFNWNWFYARASMRRPMVPNTYNGGIGFRVAATIVAED